MKAGQKLSFFTLLLLLSLISFGQQTMVVSLTKYTQTEGLSSYYVTKIFKDSYGFIWIGTQDGLNLFDGRSFQVFSKQNEPATSLGGNMVSDVVEDKKRNLLWVSTTYGDVCAIDLHTRIITKRIAHDSDQKPFAEKWVRALAVNGDTLWVGGLGFLSAFDINTMKPLPVNILLATGMTLADCNISRLVVDSQKYLWVLSDNFGISVIDGSLKAVFKSRIELNGHSSKDQPLRFGNLAFDGNFVYVGTNWGLRVFKQNKFAIDYLQGYSATAMDTSDILSIAVIAPGKVFCSTADGFYSYHFATRKIQAYKDRDIEDNWLNIAYHTLYDSAAGKLWVGTQSGLGSFDAGKNPFDPFTRSSTSLTKIKHAYALLPVNEKEFYCGDESGLFYVNTITKEIDKIDIGSFNFLLFRDHEGNIFLSNSSGFFTVNDRKVRPAWHNFPALKKLAADQFNSGLQYNDSLIIFGSVQQKGLSVWNKKNGTIQVFHNDSAGNRIRDLRVINNLFKGTLNGIFILTEKAIISFDPLARTSVVHNIMPPAASPVLSNFMDMCETNDSYWIATYGNGLIETSKDFKVKRIITTSEGLSNNCVYKVFSYKSSIIATTNNGLNIVNATKYTIDKYYESDGLHSSFFEQVCGYQYGDKIYAGGVNGFTIIDPAVLYPNPTPPKLYLNKVTIQTRDTTTSITDILLSRLKIPANVVQVSIDLSALNYKNSQKTIFAYRIKEEKGDWINLGSHNFLNLPPQPPGRYTFLFRSANESGVWTKEPLSLELNYLPKWYQSWWFKFMVTVVAAIILYLFFRYRLSQIRKQQEIRKTIASDLHDDIGSILNSVKIFTHLAKREPEKDTYIDEIENSVTQASLGLRDMIWVLDDSRDSVHELMERIRNYALPVCEAKKISFESELKTDLKNTLLTKTQKRNLFLIAKEIINNSIKYAACKKIKVVLVLVKSRVSLSIHDDGIGFDAGGSLPGNGINNIYYRSGQMNAIVNISSTSGTGTHISVVQK